MQRNQEHSCEMYEYISELYYIPKKKRDNAKYWISPTGRKTLSKYATAFLLIGIGCGYVCIHGVIRAGILNDVMLGIALSALSIIFAVRLIWQGIRARKLNVISIHYVKLNKEYTVKDIKEKFKVLKESLQEDGTYVYITDKNAAQPSKNEIERKIEANEITLLKKEKEYCYSDDVTVKKTI